MAALAQLDAYDKRLMEAVAATVAADPAGWLRRAAEGGMAQAAEAAAAAGGGGAGRQGMAPGPATDERKWSVLLTLARGFAQLGHYDPHLMRGLAEQVGGWLRVNWMGAWLGGRARWLPHTTVFAGRGSGCLLCCPVRHRMHVGRHGRTCRDRTRATCCFAHRLWR